MSFVAGAILNASQLNDLDIDSLVVDTDTLVVDSAAAKVGIGTTAPAELLDIHGNASSQGAAIPTVRITNTDTTAVATDVTGSLEFFSKDASDPDEVSGYVQSVAVNAGTQFALTFGTKTNAASVAEAMRIDHDGRVGVGALVTARQFSVTASQTAFELTNQSDVGAGAVTGGVVRIGAPGVSTNPGTDDYWILFRRGNGTSIGSVRGTGSASVNFSTTSDATLKTDNGLVTAERGGSIMDTLQVHNFDWNEGTVTDQIGLFAQEAIDVLPESIVNAPSVEPATADEDETYVAAALDYSKIVPILIAECQFLRQRVEALELAQ